MACRAAKCSYIGHHRNYSLFYVACDRFASILSFRRWTSPSDIVDDELKTWNMQVAQLDPLVHISSIEPLSSSLKTIANGKSISTGGFLNEQPVKMMI